MAQQLRVNTLARVLYDFNAVETSELSVHANDLVLVVDATVEDGWRKVQRQSDGHQGFVPNDYLAPLPSAAETVPRVPSVSGRDTAADAAPVRAGHEQSNAHNEQQLHEREGGYAHSAFSSTERQAGISQQTQPGSALVPSSSSSSSSVPFASLPREYTELLNNHEQWFREATAKRSEVYRNLQGQATDLGRAIVESEGRSRALLSRISELEALINDERAKWNSPAAVPAATSSSSSSSSASVPALLMMTAGATSR